MNYPNILTLFFLRVEGGDPPAWITHLSLHRRRRPPEVPGLDSRMNFNCTPGKQIKKGII